MRGLQEGLDVVARCEEDEDGESARTHRWRRHKALEGNLVQGDVGIPVCWLPHLPRSAWCLQLHGRWHPHGRACQREDRLLCYTRWYEYCNAVADPGLWKFKHTEANSCPNIITTYNFLSRVTPLLNYQDVTPHSFPILHCNF